MVLIQHYMAGDVAAGRYPVLLTHCAASSHKASSAACFHILNLAMPCYLMVEYVLRKS